MIDAVISQINTAFEPFTQHQRNTAIHGLARPVLRVKRLGDAEVMQVIPCTVDRSGEGVEVGVDDAKSLIVYHKLNQLSHAVRPGTGRGDAVGDWLWTYNMSLVVYYGMDGLKMMPDELLLQLQHLLPKPGAIKPFKMAVVKLGSSNLNAFQVHQQEYQGVPFRLKLNDILFSVNYTVEAYLDPKCVELIC